MELTTTTARAPAAASAWVLLAKEHSPRRTNTARPRSSAAFSSGPQPVMGEASTARMRELCSGRKKPLKKPLKNSRWRVALQCGPNGMRPRRE